MFYNDDPEWDMGLDFFNILDKSLEPLIPYPEPVTPKCYNYSADIIFDEYMPIDPDLVFKEKCQDYFDCGIEDVFNVPNEESLLIHINGHDVFMTESPPIEQPPPELPKPPRTARQQVDHDHCYCREEVDVKSEMVTELPPHPFETPPDTPPYTPEETIVPVGRQKLRSSTIYTKKVQEVLSDAVSEALGGKKSIKRKQCSTKNAEAPPAKYSRTSNKNSVCKSANNQKRTKSGKAENPKKKSPKGRTDHSANERIRRDILKRAFTSLRERVPIQCMLTEKDKPTALISKQKILTGAIKYITGLMEEKRECKRSLRRIFEQCTRLKETHSRMYKKVCKRHRH